jgi:hypothetical protein
MTQGPDVLAAPGSPPLTSRATDWVALLSDEIPLGSAMTWAARPDCGALVTFCGTPRDAAIINRIRVSARTQLLVGQLQSNGRRHTVVDTPARQRLACQRRDARNQSHGVEVSGLEPPTSTMRKYGSQRLDQGLSEDIPGRGVAIPSGSITIPPLPSR